MKKLKLHKIGLTVLVVTLTMTLWAGYLIARTGGISGICVEVDGCSCHGPVNDNGNATVAISGPQTVDVNSTNSYTISITGGPAGTTGGFNLCADGGALVAGTGNKLDAGELVHDGVDSRSWTFEWTAPGTEGTTDFTAIAQATNGGGTAGDSWNWYGGAVGTPFTITVMATVPVHPTTWGLLKDLYQ
jgi:hypothetical protein